jgi:molybdopterin-guanine dinucleotide biosynthesis protein A
MASIDTMKNTTVLYRSSCPTRRSQRVQRGWYRSDVETSQPALSAAILTGGRASRMGGVRKGTLEIDGQRIIDRQLAVLRPITPSIFMVSSATGETDADADGGLPTVRDRVADCGALGGIYTAIEASPSDRTLVLACDLPFLSAALITHMAGLDADLVIPRGERGYEPLCAIYARACADPIRRRLEHGELAASALPAGLTSEGLRVVEIGPEKLAAYDADGLLFVNVNTPHDYERARELQGRHRIMDELGR